MRGNVTILKATLVIYQLTCACTAATFGAEPQRDKVVVLSGEANPVTSEAHPTDAPVAVAVQPVLSPQAEQVRQIAEQNGDKTFLMLDKARGEIILFENDQPIFSGAALTGVSMGDRIPPGVLAIPGLHPLKPEQKVTPAGRFTVRQELDPEFGTVWTINEIHGIDWDIAIHQVYLGTPSEHRDARLRSLDASDRQITWGCINVDKSTIRLFTQKLPHKGKTALYILPRDTAMTAAFFPPLKVSAK
jgi:hypothetical protein